MNTLQHLRDNIKSLTALRDQNVRYMQDLIDPRTHGMPGIMEVLETTQKLVNGIDAALITLRATARDYEA